MRLHQSSIDYAKEEAKVASLEFRNFNDDTTLRFDCSDFYRTQLEYLKEGKGYETEKYID
jgi:hypothetical protein